jgi:hypothetical protein
VPALISNQMASSASKENATNAPDVSDAANASAAVEIDISDSGRDFMSLAAEAIKKGSTAAEISSKIEQTAAQKKSIEKAAVREEVRKAMAEQKGVTKMPSGGSGALAAVEMTADEKEEAEEAAAAAEAEAVASAAKAKASQKSAVECAAAKAAEQHAAVKDMLKAAAAQAVQKEEDGPIKTVPLKFTTQKIGAGVSLGGDGEVASAGALACQLTDAWMQGGRKPLIWTIAMHLEEITPGTTIGIVGRNFWSSEWERSLETSTHAIVLRCGDGSIRHKGKGTSFMLRPLKSGAKLTFTLDMQTLEMTIDLIGKGPGDVISSLTVENIQSEVTLAVGFAKGPPQRVRLLRPAHQPPASRPPPASLSDL